MNIEGRKIEYPHDFFATRTGLIISLIIAGVVAWGCFLLNTTSKEKASTGHGSCVLVHTAEAAKRVIASQPVEIRGGKITYRDIFNKEYTEYHTWIEGADLTNDAPLKTYDVFYSYHPDRTFLKTVASLRIYKMDRITPKAIFENISFFEKALKEEKRNG